MEPLKPFISVILPCFNEEVILEQNFSVIVAFLKSREQKYKWEILIINDGSKDNTGIIADKLERNNESVRVIHHPVNLNLGRALQTGFCNAKGDIFVVLDVDLSYSVEYIEKLTDKMIETSCDIVLASPYMKGGKVTSVPFGRKIMSRIVNRFMQFSAQDNYYTFTGMVRAYRSNFIRSVNLKTKDYEVNPEIMYKAMILRARIVEIPAHLDWTEQNKYAGKRTSSMRVLRGFFSGLMSAFIFRPYIFFLFFGLILLALSLFQLVWLLYDTVSAMASSNDLTSNLELLFSTSLREQFQKNPQTFIVGGITLIASLQFLGFGFISLQNKRYFEELFHLGTSLKKNSIERKMNANR